MQNEEILNKIQKIAGEAGFDLVGIANTAVSDELLAISHSEISGQNHDELAVSDKLDEWIENGYHADMKWMANPESLEKRKDILKVMPDAKSVICVAMNYYGEENSTSPHHSEGLLNSGDFGRVARYAYGRDYHKIFDKKLKLFVKKLEEVFCHPPVPVWTGSHPPKGRVNYNGNQEKITKDWIPAEAGMTNAKFKYYSDTGPVLERAWAARAGLGFIGKNTNLITQYGSWVLLGEIITNIEIPTLNFQLSTLNSCGSCRKCFDACPTGALCAPYTVDARKCISYLTIEYKGEIPMELREKMGNRIFGCDACQEVCPFNIGRQTEGINFKVMQDKLPNLSLDCYSNPMTEIGKMRFFNNYGFDLKEILSIKTDEEFLKKFAGSPVMRAKRKGLVRNACIAAGNSGDKSLLPYLEECAKDNDPVISEAAEWAIQKLKGLLK